ncbi:unnamed protein product [Symbiodinium sp. CCMP2592]|nr:unnamed protein product [Symbiodinium sp. CCMP2592]
MHFFSTRLFNTTDDIENWCAEEIGQLDAIMGPASVDKYFYSGERVKGESFSSFIAGKEEGWDSLVHLPGPGYSPGQHFHLLADGGWQELFSVGEGRRRYFKQDIATQLQCRHDELSLLRTNPAVTDSYFWGHICGAVTVATTQLATVPVPPARQTSRSVAVVVDCRRIHRGFKWLLSDCGVIALARLENLCGVEPPVGYSLHVHGAPVEHHSGAPCFRVSSGQLFVAEFVKDALLSASADVSMGPEVNLPLPVHHDAARVPGASSDGRNRSRSPRSTPREHVQHAGHTVMLSPDLMSGTAHEPESEAPPTSVALDDRQPDRTRYASDDADQASTPTGAGASPVLASFGVLSPDYAVETVTVLLSFPLSVADALAAVAHARSPTSQAAFPVLVPAFLQPDARWGTLVALPSWAHQGNFVCADAYDLQQRIYCFPAPSEMSGAALSEALGLTVEEPGDIFVNGQGPILSHEEAFLATGACIQVVRRGTRPTSHVLQDMLQQPSSWAAPPAFPVEGIRDRICLVTASGTSVYRMSPGGIERQRRELAQVVGCPPAELFLRPGTTRGCDAAVIGHPCHSVVAALAIGQLPLDVNPVVCLMDCRRVLQGWTPLLSRDGWIDTYPLLEYLRQDLPQTVHVVIQGVPRDQQWIRTQSGQVLVVVALSDTQLAAGAGPLFVATPESSPPDPDQDDDRLHWQRFNPLRAAHGLTSDTGGAPVPDTRQCHALSMDRVSVHDDETMCMWTQAFDDTRADLAGKPLCTSAFRPASPRSLARILSPSGVPDRHVSLSQPGAHQPVFATAPPSGAGSGCFPSATAFGLVCAGLVSPTRACTIGGLSAANADTTWLPPAHGVAVAAWCVSFFAVCCLLWRFVGILQYKLLCEPTSTSLHADAALRAARTGTLRLGLPWPFTIQRLESADPADDASSSSQEESEEVCLDISCIILAPCYEPERVTFETPIPATVAQVAHMAQQCRAGPACVLLPRLLPVWPQPDPRWAVFLALPTWQPPQPVVCFDMYTVDGRMFAQVTQSPLCRRILLELAGLPLPSSVRIYKDNHLEPVAPEDWFEVRSGACFSFVPLGVRQDPLFSAGMLESHLSWDAPPAFPRAAVEDCYCLVDGNSSCLFTLHPARAPFYRADIGNLLDISPTRLTLAPADPRPGDVWHSGFPCRTAIAAYRTAAEPSCPFLLDCRSFMRGWQCHAVAAGILGVTWVEANLGLPARGYAYHYAPAPSSARVWHLRPGQVIQIYLLPLRGSDVSLHPTQATVPVSGPLVDGAGDAHPSNVSAHVLSANSNDQDDGQRRSSDNGGNDDSVPSAAAPAASGSLLLTAVHGIQPADGPPSRNAHKLRGGWAQSSAWLFASLVSILSTPGTAMLTSSEAEQVPRLPAPSSAGDTFMREVGSSACALCPVSVAHNANPVQVNPIRLLPTPCRASAGRPAVSGAYDFLTLLDESARASDHWAFLAATLLDTLTEHFCHVSLDKAQTGLVTTPKPTLQLDVLIPEMHAPNVSPGPCATEYFDLDARNCRIPCSLSMFQDLTRAFPFTCLAGAPATLHKPERFSDWVAAGCVGRAPAPDEIVTVTTDGSYSPTTGAAGWADAIGPSFGDSNAYLAEVAALFWGGVVAFRLASSAMWLFRADNISALLGVSGANALQQHPLCAATAAVHAGLGVLKRDTRYQHVLGHAADPANELADALAGRAASTGCSPAPLLFSLDGWFDSNGAAFDWLPHVCATTAQPRALPDLRQDCLSWSRDFTMCADPDACMRPFLRNIPSTPSEPTRPVRSDISIELATFNVLSLLDPGASSHAAGLHGATGRVRLLCESLDHHGMHLVGLQECRTFQGTARCSGFVRLASGRDDNACFGVELWIRDGSPFDSRKAVVLHAEPTFLIASLSLAGEPVKVLVAHAPHRAHTEDFRKQWWERVSKACATHSRAAHWIVLADGNCRLGEITSAEIGDHHPDQEDLSGSLMRDLVSSLQCWLPATFSHSARGSSGTLYQKRNGAFVRSDYVAIPLAWSLSQCVAQVQPEISTGHSVLDHFAATVSLRLRPRVPAIRRPPVARIDPEALAEPENQDRIRAIISSAPHVSWDTDASEHAAILAEHWYQGLVSAFPLPRRRMRGRHFSEETSRLHAAVSLLRRSVRGRSRVLLLSRLRCALLAWKSHKDFMDFFTGRWLWRLQVSRALDYVLLHRHGPALRRSCRRDRSDHFATLAERIASAPCAEVHQEVRRVLRPQKFRKGGPEPLPMLHKADGHPCASHEEIATVCRDHFRSLEAGQEVAASQLATACSQRQQAVDGADVVPSALVPTWAHLHAAFRATAPHKAQGPDLLPPMLCTLFSTTLTEAFWPVLLQTVLRSNEPVGLKGGVMHRISKPPAAAHTTAGYRGILVQSCLSKVLHRATRHLAVAHWNKHILPLQLGGRKGCPAAFGHFCSRAFLAYARATGQTAAILFVDIAAAYYGVIREAIFGAREDQPIEVLAASLGLSRADLQQVHVYITEEPVLREQGAHELFCELASELHANTWFVLAGDSSLIETKRGTRPGGSLADVIFSMLFSKVLHRRDQCSERGSLVPRIPWHGCRAPRGSLAHHAAMHVDASDVVYADDLASFLVCASAASLPRAISAAAADTIDVLLPHGLNANIGPTKTAAIAAPVGRGSRAVRGQLFHQSKGRLVVLPENRGAFRLDLEGKQRLFACKSIPLARRATLFRSHVLGTVLAGVGTWPFLNGQEWAAFSGGITSLVRQLLCLRTEGGFSCSHSQIFCRAGLPLPQDLLHMERLRFLGQLVRHGPDSAWALLSWYCGFRQALTAASTWLLQAVRSTCPLGNIDEDWISWEKLIRDSPGRWKSLIKRAGQWHLVATCQAAALETFARASWPAAVPTQRPDVATCVHACLRCRVAFHTRQQWGAHAHRTHGYHSRAHTVAQGRRCQACGLLVASEARLRTHLRLSLSCVQRLDASGGIASFPPEGSSSHPQAPAQPGIGKRALGPASVETLPPLAAALDELANAGGVTDQRIFDTIVSFMAPLPVLRSTLTLWLDSVHDPDIVAAARDVLLVLHPEHLCDTVAGGLPPTAVSEEVYHPSVVPLSLALPLSAGSLTFVGRKPSAVAWASSFSALSAAPVEWSFEQLHAGLPAGTAGVFVEFPALPADCTSIFFPPACPLKVFRQLREWTDSALSALGALLAFARTGRPVGLVFPMPRYTLEPLATWLLGLKGDTEDLEPFHCFTAEFIDVQML